MVACERLLLENAGGKRISVVYMGKNVTRGRIRCLDDPLEPVFGSVKSLGVVWREESFGQRLKFGLAGGKFVPLGTRAIILGGKQADKPVDWGK